ncbi:hypothetical protein [Nocardia australiensis]|uniref:hypothetical protein n=1 Tax=Nocardia australiensis TaxID=2887191 RepID=UPI001D1427BA|nr:hypothetical protein [Nocardia australiensis]
MSSVNRMIGHVIVLTSPTEMIEISDRLEKVGFSFGNEVVEQVAGIKSRMLPIHGGGFIELASELSPGSFLKGKVFDRTPRIFAVTYTTDDAGGELARWRQLPGLEHASAQVGSWKREDGTMGHYLGVAPTPPVGEIFFGLRDSFMFPPPYLEVADTAPRISRITVTGPDAESWRTRHEELFSLPERDGVLHAGPTELIFEQETGLSTEIALTLSVPRVDVDIELTSGRIRFVSDADYAATSTER